MRVALLLLYCLWRVPVAFAQGTNPAAPGTTADVIHGRILNDSTHPIAGAAVYVTRGSDRQTQQVATDSAGTYNVRFDNGTGDYLVFVSAVGFQSARRRVQRKTTETDFVVDFTLARQVKSLDAVQVSAKRSAPPSNNVNPFSPEAGSDERWQQGVDGQIPPTLLGNLSAIAGTMPNVTLGASGPSILGAGGASNLQTLNGMGFSGGAIPRAANVQTRVTASTYDPARGGFTGANVDLQLGPGDRMFQNRNAFITLNPRQWQFADAPSRALGAQNGGITASFGADGELIRKALTYNLAFDLTHEIGTPSTLMSANRSALVDLGVSPDSVSRITSVAPTVGLTLSGSGIPNVSQHDAFTWLSRFDDTRDTLQTRALTTYVGFSRLGAVGFAPLSAPSTAGEQHDRTLGAQLTLDKYFGAQRVLSETHFAASQVHTTTTPYRAQPTAVILTPSQMENGTTDIGSVTLGGGSSLFSDVSNWTVEGSNQIVWDAGKRRTHHFKTQLWGRIDGTRQQGMNRDLGAFTFNSINDFATNTPASFFRTLTQPTLDGTVWNAATSVTHSYTVSPLFSMIYGVRVDADGFTSAPEKNADLDHALGIQSGAAPSRVHLSPRFGFSYKYLRKKKGDDPRRSAMTSITNPLGHFYVGSSGVIRGGIGEFRDLLRPGIRATAGAATGLPGSTLTVSCIGSAIPTIDWTNFSADASTIPTQCTDGSGQLAERAPAVTAIDPSYDVPHSWRGSLDWTTSVRSWQVRLGTLAAYNLSQPGTVNANFSGTPRLTLANEADRPVYVSPSGIDPNSGSVSAAESRLSDQYGPVGMRVSDLRGYGGQFTFNVSPTNISSMFMSAGYTLQWVRREYRGFDGAAFGDPRIREWAPDASDARHVFVLSGGWNSSKIGTVTLFGRFQSGLPYTPIVQGDVNGDGQIGDRAFIPNLTSETTPGLSSQLQSLLTNGTATARQCLNAYSGQVAGLNGCRGPWTQSLNLQWSPQIPVLSRSRVQANVYVQNILAGLDQAIHGENSLRGWGSQATPDPVLLIPRSFDPTAHQFTYDVNPHFGDTRSSRTLSANPFQVMLDFHLNLSTDYDVQELQRAVEPVRGAKGWEQRSAKSITESYLAMTSDLYKPALAQSDSLFLSTAQVTALERADSIYSERVRALYLPLGEFLAEQGGGIGHAALDSVKSTQKVYWKIFWEQADTVASIITPVQSEYFDLMKMLLSVPAQNREYTKIKFGNPVTLLP